MSTELTVGFVILESATTVPAREFVTISQTANISL